MAILLVALVVAFGAVFMAFGVFLVVAGVRSGVAGVKEWLLSRSAARWSAGTATISSVTVIRSGMGRSTSYTAGVTYAFQHGGRSHTGTRLAFSTSFSPGFRTESEAARAVEPFGKGAKVPVFYDAGRPEHATLQRNRPGLVEPLFFLMLLVTMGFVFSWLGIYVAVGAIQNPPNLSQ